jgi:hypothetical protein
MFDWKKPTVQMLGRWQPWHDGHTELFTRAHAITGQVVIMVRDVQGASGGDGQDDNPFDYGSIVLDASTKLLEKGFTINKDYTIMRVPNIVDISYGRGVGYTFTEHDLGKEIHNISATKIREQMRKEGKLDAKH